MIQRRLVEQWRLLTAGVILPLLVPFKKGGLVFQLKQIVRPGLSCLT
jgi:hypothetical protein